MSKPFKRAPRIFPDMPGGEEEVHGPEAEPTRPSTSLSSRFEDIIFTGFSSIGGAAVMFFVSKGSTASTIIGGFTMLIFGALRALVGYRREQKTWQTACQERTRK